MKRWLPLAALALSALPLSAHALKLSIVGAGNYANADNQSAADYSAKASFGAGGLLEFRLLPAIGLEVGALYVPRQYELGTNSSTYTTKQNLLQVPVMLRANLMNVLSLGVGGYYGKYLGSPTYTAASGTAPLAGQYGSGGLASSDYGTIASLAVYTSLTPLTRLLFDARYVISAKAFDEAAPDRKFRDVQLLVGLQMGL